MTLGIYGAGGLGREIYELAKQINNIENRWDTIIFIDDSKETSVKQRTVLAFDQFITMYKPSEAEICIAVGEPFVREKLAAKINDKGYILASLIHPSVYIPDSTVIGQGAIICTDSFISCDVVIMDNVLIQPHTNVGHDCIVRNNSVISGFANIAGACEIMENTYIALSVCIKEKVRVGAGSIVGMGAVVIYDVADNTIALGIPARAVKENIDQRVFKH